MLEEPDNQKQKEGPGRAISRKAWYPEVKSCYYCWAVATAYNCYWSIGRGVTVGSGSTRIVALIRAETVAWTTLVAAISVASVILSPVLLAKKCTWNHKEEESHFSPSSYLLLYQCLFMVEHNLNPTGKRAWEIFCRQPTLYNTQQNTKEWGRRARRQI